jgi:hypothetical protein
MKPVVMMALVGVMALIIGTAAFPTKAYAGRGGHRTHFSHNLSYGHHFHQGGFHHSTFRHPDSRYRHSRHHRFYPRSYFSLFFGYPLSRGYYGPPYPGYYGPPYPGYYYPGYTYQYAKPLLTYKETPQEQGYLKLEIFPEEAEVYLDGNYWGKAASLAGRAIAVSPGVHQLRLSLGGFSNYYQLDVSADETLSFNKTIPDTG